MEDTPAIFLAGARQTGKSTLARKFQSEGFGYWTFDDLGTLASARTDPEGFVAAIDGPAVLDEVQRAPGLFLPLKASIDRDRRPGRFLLTGSADVLALPRVAETLAGRMEVLTLWPLAQAEVEGVQPGFVDACFAGRPAHLRPGPASREDLVRRLLAGGYPEALARRREEARTRWFDAYVTSLLQRDVRDLAAIEGIAELPRLLQSLAARTGGPLNVADLGRRLGSSHMTLRRYLALLAALHLVVSLPPWFENLGKRLAKAPKLYLDDAGLLAHLLGIDREGLVAKPVELGPLLETFAVMEILKTAPVSRTRPAAFHFRTSAGEEVDLLLESRRRDLVGIEVKAGATVGAADFKSLRLLQRLVGERLRCGVLLYLGRQVLPFGPGLWAMPISALWAAG